MHMLGYKCISSEIIINISSSHRNVLRDGKYREGWNGMYRGSQARVRTDSALTSLLVCSLQQNISATDGYSTIINLFVNTTFLL